VTELGGKLANKCPCCMSHEFTTWDKINISRGGGVCPNCGCQLTLNRIGLAFIYAAIYPVIIIIYLLLTFNFVLLLMAMALIPFAIEFGFAKFSRLRRC
jgi:hypothetical protein